MTKLLNWFKSLFSVKSYSEDLETYIKSKHPTNVAEVEYWTHKYQYKESF